MTITCIDVLTRLPKALEDEVYSNSVRLYKLSLYDRERLDTPLLEKVEYNWDYV